MILSQLIPLIPAFTVLLAVALQEAAMPWPAWTVLRPDLAIIALYYWRLYRPDRAGPGLAFAAGMAVDVVSGVHLGVNAFSYLVLIFLTSRMGSRLRAVHYTWQLLGLLVLVVIHQALELIWMGLLKGGGMVRWELVGGRMVATMLVAPAVTALLIRVHRAWVEADGGR